MKRHQFHLVDSSTWPFVCSLGLSNLLLGLIFFMQQVNFSGFFVLLSIFILIVSMFSWWRDVIREGTYLGDHTKIVQKGIRMGFILFLVSELMVFFALFWAFFHYSLSVSVELGGVWPPVNIVALSAYGIPLYNTMLLLWSGFSLTCAHISMHISKKETVLSFLGFAILLGLFFILLQGFEYFTAPFNISDSVYGSIFFGLTGLHGLHVIIGVIFLSVCYYRIYLGQFTGKQYLGFDFAAWYWHFVDVIWIFVFLFVYIWGGYV